MTFLLDASVLIPMCFPEHVHRKSAVSWFADVTSFAVCPMTEGALLRYVYRSYRSGAEVGRRTFEQLSEADGYTFWGDEISFSAMRLDRVSGHQQVTDAYLVALARHRGGRLATFDRALAALYTDAFLVPFVD